MYEKRVIVYIDILGFKNLIYKYHDSRDQISEIIKVIEKIHDLCGKTGADDEPEYGYEYNRQVSVFSDNIAISYKDEGPAEYYLVREAMVIQSILQYLGIYIRGGLTRGDLYHKDNVIVGPALIRAYELEANVAIFPRIVVDGMIQADWCMLAKDFDGIYFLDYLGNADVWAYFVEHSEEVSVEEYLSKINKDVFSDNNYLDLRVKAKHDWMKKYMTESIKCINGRFDVIRHNQAAYIR